MKEIESYQFTVSRGDIVRLPNGDLGVVARQEIICAGHCNQITIYPFVSLIKRIFGSFLLWYRFEDQAINRLQKVGSIVF